MNPGNIENSEIIKYQSWLIKNGLSFKNGNINVKKDDGSVISGKLDWSKSKKYEYKGRAYLEVPFLFHHNPFLEFMESSGTSEFSIVFRHFPNDEIEAAIRTTTSGRIFQDEEGNKNEGTIQSFSLINGEKKTLWVKRKDEDRFIKVNRINNAETLKGKVENNTIMRSYCTTFSYTAYSVSCSGDVECVVYSYTSYFTYCAESPQNEGLEPEWPGGGGGGNPPPPPTNQPDPCNTALAMGVSSFSSIPIFDSAKSQIQSAASDGFEHAVSFGKDNNGTIIQSTMSTGDETSGTTPWISNKFADIHNHKDNSPPSPGDVYSFIDGLTNQPNFTTRYVIASGGDVYALVITDRQAAINFNSNNPRVIETYVDSEGKEKEYPPSFPDDIFDKIGAVKDYLFNNGVHSSLLQDESSFSYILQEYNVGISLLKMNNSREFKKIKTKETNSNGNPTFTPDNCL